MPPPCPTPLPVYRFWIGVPSVSPVGRDPRAVSPMAPTTNSTAAAAAQSSPSSPVARTAMQGSQWKCPAQKPALSPPSFVAPNAALELGTAHSTGTEQGISSRQLRNEEPFYSRKNRNQNKKITGGGRPLVAVGNSAQKPETDGRTDFMETSWRLARSEKGIWWLGGIGSSER